MRKTIASQNIIGTQHPPSIFYPFPFPRLRNPRQNYSSKRQKLICDSLTMIALAPTTIRDQTHPASKTPQEAETKGLIVLNKVPIADDPLGLSRQLIVEHHPVRDPNGPTTQSDPSSQTNATPQANLLDNNSSLLSQGENSSMLQSTLQVDMTHQINKYFEQCASNIRDFEVYRDKLVLVSNHKIKKLIKRGQLEVSDKCHAISFKERAGARGKSIEAKRRAVEQEKYEAIRKLKTIQQQQIELMHKYIKQGRNKSVQIKKSPFTQQQRQKIAEILKAKQQFEKSLQQKTDEYIKNNQLFKKQQQEQHKKMQQTQNNRKKQEIAKRLKQMEHKTQQRKQSLRQSALKFPHNYAHKKIEKNYRSLQKLNKEQFDSKLKEISMKHKLNIEQINQHDRKYSQLLEKRSQSLSLLKLAPESQTKRYNSTKFSKVVEEELFQIKEKNMQKIMKVKENQYKAKIAKYQQKIDQEHKPKVDTTKSIPTISRAYSTLSLTKQERVEKGLEYLAKAKQMKRSISQFVQQPKVEQKYGYKAYKDYLKERESSQNANATEKQLKQIMAKKDSKDYRELLRAKFLAEGLQEKSKKRPDDKLYFSAKIKLSLLSQLYSQI